MPIFRAHTCSTLTIPARPASRGISSTANVPLADLKKSTGSVATPEGPSKRTLNLLDVVLSPSCSRPSSSASRGSFRSSMNSPSSRPLRPLTSPKDVKVKEVHGKAERDTMDRFQRKRSKEKMEGKADSKESIQLPHLAARRSLDKERIESKSCSSLPSARPSTGLSSTGSLGESRRGLGVDLFDEISDVASVDAALASAREKSPSPSVVPTESRPMSRPVPPDHLLSLMKKEAKQEAREPKMSKDRPNSKSRRKTRRSGSVEKQFRRLHEGQKNF